MTGIVKDWIFGVACGGMIVAVLQALLPKDSAGKVGRMAGGLVLLLAVASPLVQLDWEALTVSLTEQRMAEQGYTEELTKMNQGFLKELIEEQTEAYILDKAEGLGISCEVSVRYRWSEDGVPYPAEVTVVSDAAEEQEQELARLIEGELGVPIQDQVYERKVE